jgi:phosphoglycerol transferase MdoB-like AlkP superfamily enzyme
MHPVLAGRMEYGDLHEATDFLREHTIRPVSSRFAPAFERMLRATAATPTNTRPHVVLVQAESFCDIREHLSGAQREALRDFLPNWDRLQQSGRGLPTPKNAYGAYSMRTEFSMLSGLKPEALGPWALNPYILAARRPLWSLAWFFRDLGYETLCLHPYHKRFFGRDKVMPNLGFQRFLSVEELGAMEKFGPYVSDAALGRRIVEELEGAQRPVFCFVITMEAHGPWLHGRLTEQEIAETLEDVDVGLFDEEMRMYLCHIRHMDGLFGMLDGGCSMSGHEVSVWAYGDHRPGIDTYGHHQNKTIVN